MANNPSQPQYINIGNTPISKVYSHASGSEVQIRPMGPTWTTLRTGLNSSVESDGSTALRIMENNYGEIATILAEPGIITRTPPSGYHRIYQEELYILWKWMGLRGLDYSRFIGELENLNGGSYQDIFTYTIGYQSYGLGKYTFSYNSSSELSNLNPYIGSYNSTDPNSTLFISDTFYVVFNTLINEIYGFYSHITLTGSNFRYWFPYCLEYQRSVRINIEAQNQLRTTIFAIGYPFDYHEQRQPPINPQYGGLYTEMQGDTIKLYGASTNDMLNTVSYYSYMDKRGMDTIVSRYHGELMVQDGQYQQAECVGISTTDRSQMQGYTPERCSFQNSTERDLYDMNPYIALPNDYVQIQSGYIDLF